MVGVRWGLSEHGARKARAMMAPEAGIIENELMTMFSWASPAQAALYTENVYHLRLASRAADLFADEMRTSALKV